MPTSLVVECLDVLLPVLTRILNLSLQTGCFPDNWKQADVHAKVKKPRAEVTFYLLRPISDLSFVSKLVERAVFNQTHDYLTLHELYPKAQSSYREFHSTETALLGVINDILLNMNRQGVTLLLLLDLSAAFDTFDHSILLDRLHTHFGISAGTCAVLVQVLLPPRDSNPYLFTAEHRRSLRQSMAFHKDLVLVSPHFSSTQARCSRSSNVIMRMPMTRSCTSPSMPTPVRSIQRLWRTCKMRDRMLSDRLKLNDDKTEFIIIGTRQELAKVNIESMRVGDSTTTPASEVKNLGTWFDRQLTMNTHINNIYIT